MTAVAGPAGPVLVVGSGLLGTSIGLALRRHDVTVWLADVASEHVRTASGLGAGVPVPADASPALVVVAVPPDLLGPEVARALEEHPEAVVTDVGSVKTAPLAELREKRVAGLARYVGSHPMAGSERSGPLAGSASLFDGRPWAIAPHPGADPAAVAAVTALAELCGATPVRMTPEEHDLAVARTSHLPHLMSVLAAGRLAGAPAEHLALSGQGVRDVTRIAAGDPGLWQQIVSGNAAAVLRLLGEVRGDLDALISAIERDERDGVVDLLDRGVRGTLAIPGKHGGPPRPTESVFVAVPDHPGELARLFADAGEIGVNIEDVHIDHDPGRPVGLVELVVEESRAELLADSLESRNWVTHR
ncbi:prephenate dehydrogenase [Nocardioides panaciterrulae]|uniref:Prephenate dehydrogenase n=1 Tax=Nocardioides panaciterrulae TaxID=661492 RepID=A0A7Y9E6M7_9ACTN|nr:prephenate dehydrogenase [Nocardioides panaciterrulae]